MPRPAWSLYAYQLIVPDEQLDLFACREAKVHLVAKQLELGGFADRTLCGGLLPALPVMRDVDKAGLRDMPPGAGGPAPWRTAALARRLNPPDPLAAGVQSRVFPSAILAKD